MTLIDKIVSFGNLSHEAGAYERDDKWLEKADAARDCFQDIVRMIGTLKTEDFIEVPCQLCPDAEENERNYCYNCGRQLVYT